jgi:hypothetical protein
VGELFTYHRLGRDFPTTVDIDAWIQRDERLAAFHAELAREVTPEAADWYAGHLLVTALSDRLDLYLNTQAKNVAAMRDALNLGGALAGIILRSPEVDDALVHELEAALAPIGGGFTVSGISFDRAVDRATQVRAIMARLAAQVVGRLQFVRHAERICCDTFTSDAFLMPPPAPSDPFANPTRLDALEAWARAMLDDMRDAYLRRYEEDETFVRMIIGERVVKRFAWARESARGRSRTA